MNKKVFLLLLIFAAFVSCSKKQEQIAQPSVLQETQIDDAAQELAANENAAQEAAHEQELESDAPAPELSVKENLESKMRLDEIHDMHIRDIKPSQKGWVYEDSTCTLRVLPYQDAEVVAELQGGCTFVSYKAAFVYEPEPEDFPWRFVVLDENSDICGWVQQNMGFPIGFEDWDNRKNWE